MIKKIIIFFLSIIFVLNTVAQNKDKTSMTLRLDKIEFTNSSFNKKTELLEMTRQKIAEAAVESGRFTVIDDDAAESQIEYMSNEAFIDLPLEQRINYLNKLSNDFSLNAKITKCQITRKRGAANGYTCLLALTIRVVNTNAEELVVSESRTMYSSYRKLIVKNTLEAAYSDALESITNKLINYFNHNFAIFGVMTQYTDKRVVINCGSKERIKRKDEFLVNLVNIKKTFNGEYKREEQLIGTLKVDRLLADGSSSCKITSGKQKIFDTFDHLDKNSFIQCKLVLK
jgi:hypothetical protein